MGKVIKKSALARPIRRIPLPDWKRDKKSRSNLWKLFLVSGLIEVTIWDRRIAPVLWAPFDGFHCQISGEKTIDIELPGVTDVEEAKLLAERHAQAFVHQLGSELGLWRKKFSAKVTEPVILWQGEAFKDRF